MAVRTRPQQYRLKWPWTASQVEGLDEMLGTLFTTDAALAVELAGVAAASGSAWSAITGTPTTLAGYGITDAQALHARLTALAALADAVGWLHNDGAGAFAWTTPTAVLPQMGARIAMRF